VAGGMQGFLESSTDSADLYDPDTGTWSPACSMATGRYFHTATLLLNGKVLVAGGAQSGPGSDAMASAELYDPDTDTWSPAGSMAHPRASHTATLLPDGKVLVAGGDIGAGTSAELYDPETDTWSPTGSMAEDRSSHTATLLPDALVLVTGGEQGSPLSKSSAELYVGALNRLLVEDTAFVAKAAVASPTWLDLSPEDAHVVTQGDTQWVADYAWSPAVAAASMVSLHDGRFLAPDYDVYRVTAGSALAGGYAAIHEDAYVSRGYCPACVNDGLVWRPSTAARRA
jgi:hypothetical protein